MKKTNNPQRLRELMEQHKLTRDDVARIAGVGCSTVDTWLAPEGAASHRGMRDRSIRLIELELQRPKKAGKV